MDSENSLLFLRDFDQRIRRMQVNADDESFVRELLSDIVADCPTQILKELATAVMEIRKRELEFAAGSN